MCKGLSQGENIAAEGDYVEHPLYGKQFKMVTYRIEAPKDSVSMERYLASGAIKGIGAALATRIVKKFGAECLFDHRAAARNVVNERSSQREI